MSTTRLHLAALPAALILTVGPWLTSCAAGCSLGPTPGGLGAADLTGSYTGTPGGTLTLAADGTLTAGNWPDLDDIHYPEDGHPLPSLPITGSGTWKLTNDYDGERVVEVTLPTASGKVTAYHESLWITGTRAHPELWQYIGDPDSCEFFELKKK